MTAGVAGGQIEHVAEAFFHALDIISNVRDDECGFQEGRQTHSFLHMLPPLPQLFGQWAPRLLAHILVGDSEAGVAILVPVVAAAFEHKALVAFSAGVGRLGGKVLFVDGGPGEVLGSRLDEEVVVVGGPGAGGLGLGEVLMVEGVGWCGGCGVVALAEGLVGLVG